MEKIYLRNVVMNYSKVTRDCYNNLIFEEVEKRYPLGYIDQETGLIYGIDHDKLPVGKKLDVEFFHHDGKKITTEEFNQAKKALETSNQEQLEEFNMLLELRYFIKQHVQKFDFINPVMFKDIKANSDILNRAVGIPGYRYAKKLGWMRVLKEIKKQLL